jgi:hypothetical protein
MKMIGHDAIFIQCDIRILCRQPAPRIQHDFSRSIYLPSTVPCSPGNHSAYSSSSCQRAGLAAI